MKHKQVGIKSREDVSKQSFSKPGSAQPDFHQSSQVQHYRNIGNQAVQRMLESQAIQAKLKVGSPNDKYEQEADEMADKVMKMEEGSLVQRQPDEEEEELKTKSLLQRQVDEEKEEEEEIKPKLIDNQQLQRQEIPEEEEEEEGPVQAKLMGTNQLQRQDEPEEEEEETPVLTKAAPGSTPEVSSGIESSINTIKGGGQPLSESTRSFFEPRFGADFSQVRVHTDPHAAKTAQAINARAFTTGKDIVFNSGQYSTGTSSGKRLLAHELTHVVQRNNIISLKNKKISYPPTVTLGFFLRKKKKKKRTGKKYRSRVSRKYFKPRMNSEFQFGTIKGKFTFLLGKVRVSSDFKIVRTGKLSLVDITYDDGSIIRIFQDSIIDLERISWALSDALELRRFESSGTGYLLCLILCYLGIHTSIMKMLIDKFFKLILDAYMEVYKDKKTAAREFQEFFRYARAMGPIKLFGRILVFLATGKFPIIFRIKISPDRYLGRKWRRKIRLWRKKLLDLIFRFTTKKVTKKHLLRAGRSLLRIGLYTEIALAVGCAAYCYGPIRKKMEKLEKNYPSIRITLAAPRG